MHNDLLAGVGLTIFLGIASQLVASRTRIPSILLLLGVGLLAGPVLGLLDINHIFGELLFPLVSLSVAIILFEGGLSLRIKDIREVGGVVRNLILVGVPVTWLLSATGAYYLLGLSLPIALLFGAVLVVTGPTVIIPLLKQIRPASRVGSILRWEGIIIDPVGAVLAVLVFEEILVSNPTAGFFLFLQILVYTLVIGFVGGWIFSRIMIEAYSRYIIPFPLQNPATLMFVIVAFTISNLLEQESGLLTVTVMGFLMANQNRVDVRHIVEFKENLQVLLISSLFVILAARLEPSVLAVIDWRLVTFIAGLILVMRPMTVWLSTLGMRHMTWKERLFLSWMAPRGIVAAAVASIFAAELAEQGFEEARLLVPYTFAVIIITVAVYSLTAGLAATVLKLRQENPQGVLILGAQPWAQRIALLLQGCGYRVIVADSNLRNIQDAEAAGLETYYGNILSDVVLDEIDFGGIGRMIALTPNDEVNSLASLHFKQVFSEDEVYQLVTDLQDADIAKNLSGRHLFGEKITYNYLNQLFKGGAKLETLPISNVEEAQQQIDAGWVPLFWLTKDGQLNILTKIQRPTLQEGGRLIGIAG